MALTPLDIRSQSFTRRLRGFDADEVEAFLSILAEHYDDLQRDVRHRETRIADLESKLVHYERIEEALQEALRTARESQRHALDTAARQAEQIRVEAALEARSVVQEAEHDRNRLRQETQAIAARRKEIVARLRGFLMSEMEMLAHFEGEDPIGFIQLRRDGDDRFGARDAARDTPAPSSALAPPLPAAAPSPDEAPPEAAPEVMREETAPAPSSLVHPAGVEVLPDLPDLAEATLPDAAPEPSTSQPTSPPPTPLPSGVTAIATTAPDEAPPEPTATYTASLDAPSGDSSGASAARPHGDASVSMRSLSEDDLEDAENLPPFDLPDAFAAPRENESSEQDAFEPPADPAFDARTWEWPRDDAASQDAPDDRSGEAPELVRPSWMDDVPSDVLAAPLFAPEPAEAPIPATLPPTVAAPTLEWASGRYDPAPAPPTPPAVPSPLAERLARAAASSDDAARAPDASPVSPARYVVTSFLGDAAPSGAAPEAESEEIARVRRLLDGLR